METRPSDTFLTTSSQAIIDAAQQRVLELFNRYPDARLVYHNYVLATEIARLVLEIGQGEGADPAEVETAEIAAWFLHVGYLLNYHAPLDFSLEKAEKFLEDQEYPEDRRKAVSNCIRTVIGHHPPTTPAEAILTDAAQVATLVEGFEEKNSLLQLEWQLILNRHFNRLEWSRLQLQHLLQVQLHTHFARANYESAHGRNIHKLKNRIDKDERNRTPESEAPEGLFQGLEGDAPMRATQTFFRANYRNHINLSSIADNKANIMISVNSILISVLITFLSYRNIGENNPMVLLPVIIFLVTGLASLIFAVLSARPKVTMLNDKIKSPLERRRNIVFFGNFVHLDLDEFEEAMDAVFRDSELLYGNMTRDLYYLGKVLDKKYRYLTISYNIFMVGFIATVGTFLFVLLG